jgi:hypothetical protein
MRQHRSGEFSVQYPVAFSADWHLFTNALDAETGAESTAWWDISDTR